MNISFYEAWFENDYNPFILFTSEGKIKSLNQEAQYLLGEVETKEIFELTKVYASHSYGFRTTALDLSFGSFGFYAITIGYLDENQIGIKLYKTTAKKFTSIEEEGDSINLYTLLDLCISASSTRSKAKFTKEFDPTFPDIKLQVNSFTKLLDKIYQSHILATTINTKLSLIIGEYIRQNNKKYPIFSITVESDLRDKSLEKEILSLATKSNTMVRFYKNSTILNSTMMT
jgi:hypothetical protein